MTAALVPLRLSRDRTSARAPLVSVARPRRVALVSAPFGGVDTPSLALGVLAATLRRDGHTVDVHHLDLDVVRAFGLADYRWVAEDSGWRLMVGEWLASDASVMPGRAPRAQFEEFLRARGTGAWRSRQGAVDLARLRALFDAELSTFLSRTDWQRYDVVGFTVMFQQLNASLRLARAIKADHPRVRVVLGGINLEGPAGVAVASNFPWLDAVFTGYADKTFPRWVRDLPEAGDTLIAADEEPIVLDDVPIPEFDEYFRRLDELGLTRSVRPQVPLEIARGCWWGQKHHCIFCGLNGSQMVFFDKSPTRVVEEIRQLKRHKRKLFLVDNILAPRAFDELLPRLRDEGAKLDLRWSASLKANLTRPQLERLLEAGIDVINPGIESLSSDVLRLMDKGETSIQNVWLLRACRELGIVAEWHLLWGFPSEDPAAYVDQATLIPKLAHLPPPLAAVEVELVRFSPMQKWPERFGITEVRPHPAYAHAFGEHPMIADLAYHFEFRFPGSVPPAVYARAAIEAAATWRARAASIVTRPRCEVVWIGPWRFVLDTRCSKGRRFTRLSTSEWQLLEALDRPTLDGSVPHDDATRTALTALEQRSFVLRRDGRWMRLVVFPAARRLGKRLVNKVVTAVRRAT
jgi:ribosomal peptide maturation radical SAM protein 1